jgi:peptidoglycan/xylan/chitin deacetylase (PgdA/CDA1 family)
LKGWKTTTDAYIENMVQAENVLPKTNLFRPPYGKITKKQAREIFLKGYQIVMWDVLSGDFDLELEAITSYEKVLKHTTNGSIVVFHDSLKAKNKVLKILPQLLSQWKKEGYNFDVLN